MKPLNKKLFEYPLVLVKNLDSGDLVTVDSKTTVIFLDKQTFKLKSGFKSKISLQDYAFQSVDFTSDGVFFAVIDSSVKESKLFNVKTKKVVAKTTRHQGRVSCVGIDPLSRYMFSCGEDGKTFVTDIKSTKLAFTLPIHSDAINDIAFSDNGVWLATASYDKKVFLFNIDGRSFKHKLIGHSAAVMKLQFLNLHRLFSVDKKSNGIVWDMKSGKVIKRLDGIHDIVVQVTKSSDNKFLFLATELGYILVYELENYELLSSKYIKFSSCITSLCFDGINQNLLVATASNELYNYYIYSGRENMQELSKRKLYAKAYQYIEINPLLKYTKIYEKMEFTWERMLKKAILALEKNDKKSAIESFVNFKNIPLKKTIIKKTMEEYVDFEKFSAFAKQGKLALAYSLANKHPMYKNSSIFKSMEANWKKAFSLAQQYSLDPKAKDKAREILNPYRGVSEKTKLIQSLSMQGDVYRRFKISLGQKDFKLAFELIRHNPFLREFKEYDMLMNYADTLYIKSQKYLQDNEIHMAIKILRMLLDFDDFKEEAKNILGSIELEHKFYEAIKKEDFISAYNIMASFEELQETKEGRVLQQQWNDDLQKANGYAVDGDVISMKNILSQYMKIHSRYKHLATMFALAYTVQLEQAIRQRKEQLVIENGIKNYVSCFGIQEQIEVFYRIFKKYYPKSKLNLEVLTKGSLEMWRPSMIVNSILD